MAKQDFRKQKFDQLGPTGQRLSRIPRYGHLIALLPPERLDRLQSEAATFWEVYTYQATSGQSDTGVLDSGLKATAAGCLGVTGNDPPPDDPDFREYQIGRACDLLGAVAFEMSFPTTKSSGTDASNPNGRTDRASDTGQLKKDVVNRMYASKMATDCHGDPVTKSDLRKWLNALFTMDAGELKYFIFSAHEREIRWTDITTQAFFAAYWACRWANDEDHQKLLERVPDPNTGSNRDNEELWSFIVEMPDEAIERERWKSLLSPLYDGSLLDEKQLPIRSTELIYRSWERMKDTPAGQTFRNEFGRILEGEERQEVARRLLFDENGKTHFLPLCEKAQGQEDTGEFQMGAPADEDPGWDSRHGKHDNPLHPVRLSPYRLHRYCVTNGEYELFDPRHRLKRGFEAKVEDVSRHPVVNVSWYDAWCFAAWLGQIQLDGDDEKCRVILPSEAQWEYACRAGQQTPFTWDSGRSGDKIESDYCNFDGNYPWHRPGTSAAVEGPDRNRTVRVDGLDEDGTAFPANRWGFYHMHGNVWEWCADWYGRDYYLLSGDARADDPRGPDNGTGRVLRGGSWILYGRSCRSGARDADGPGIRCGDFGFRLAAVPAGSKQ